ncbi:uncharacterized protein LOC62_01G001547 [Vanrija pseudolonga]|uniref:Ricin B lectin domain-containing protein n=1 Tax=Vanrija pseudolonga TaxID=143232 RepID=A0AAF0Y145_9TREE|nr:hypothetical protein LOC62_01G001547 [Vanrija pseudolonga]
MYLLATLLLIATATLAAPAPAEPASTAVQTGSFTFGWGTDNDGGLIGTGAQFGPGMYNYTKLPPGTIIYPCVSPHSATAHMPRGISAPKFFYPARATTAGQATPITVNDFGPRPGNDSNVHCVDAGRRPGNGAKLGLQPCNGSSGQKWLIKLPGKVPENTALNGKVQLANTNLCWDVTDGDRKKPMQVWTCYPGNKNQEFGVFYTHG